MRIIFLISLIILVGCNQKHSDKPNTLSNQQSHQFSGPVLPWYYWMVFSQSSQSSSKAVKGEAQEEPAVEESLKSESESSIVSETESKGSSSSSTSEE